MYDFELVLLIAFFLLLSQSALNTKELEITELENISMTGTKTERLIDEVPASVTVINEKRLDK